MRKLKFRAWDNESFEMVYGSERVGYQDVYFDFRGDSFFLMQNIDEGYPRQVDAIIMQFTNYLDSEGKEIYEGDIFSPDYDEWYGFVEWYDNVWQVNWGNNSRDPLTDYHVDGFTVVGNIFENPNLINNS